MRLVVVGMTLLGTWAGVARAHSTTFPYEATVIADGIDVHSGPGRKYYATSKVQRNQRVTVHRHDPGGWYMIAPPPGSFSWIRADYVNKIAPNRGVLTANNVVVRVGSEFSEIRDVEQRRLSTGSEVEILEEKTLSQDGESVRMYKIKPPKGEYRWVPGQYVTAVSELVRQQQDRNPFAVPSQVRMSAEATTPAGKTSADAKFTKHSAQSQTVDSSTSNNLTERPLLRIDASDHGESPTDLDADRRRLAELDARLQAIIASDAAGWDFAKLEQDYRQLQAETTHREISGQIESRFATLEKHQQIKAEYEDFLRLTTETSRRDAELLSLQKNTPGQPAVVVPNVPSASSPAVAPPIVSNPAVMVPRPVQPQMQPSPMQQPQLAPRPHPQPIPAPHQHLHPHAHLHPHSHGHPQAHPYGHPHAHSHSYQHSRPMLAPQGMPPAPTTVPPPVPLRSGPQGVPPSHDGRVPVRVQVPPRYDGAGVIQRAAATFPGGPRHVLVTPEGRILAYLAAEPGVNLDQHVGRSMGVTGKRWFRNDLQSDFISVRSVTPVRLKAGP